MQKFNDLSQLIKFVQIVFYVISDIELHWYDYLIIDNLILKKNHSFCIYFLFWRNFFLYFWLKWIRQILDEFLLVNYIKLVLIYPSVHLSVFLSLYVFIYPCIHLSLLLSINLFIISSQPSMHLTIYSYIQLFYPSFHLFIHLSN